MPEPTADDTSAPPLPRTVRALAAVSFFTDASSEMVLPLLPLFLTSVLGAPVAAVGLVEGAADAVAAVLKYVSGRASDRRARKPLVVAGYGLASVVRPLMALAASPWHVLAVRVTDRIGKGLRGAPRDALIADAVPASERGRAFGLHRAADNAGAFVGPLLAFGLLQGAHVSLRTVFALSAVPALGALLAVTLGVREQPRGATPGVAGSAGPDAPWSPAFRRLLLVLATFALANATDAFLVLRATSLGMAVALAPVFWAVLHAARSAGAWAGGKRSDRVGRRRVLLLGWTAYAAAYLLFGHVGTGAWVWLVAAFYGFTQGFGEGAEKALVADVVPAAQRGAAFGLYNVSVGLAALPSSLVFGALWDRFGAAVAFDVAAGLALLAALGMAAWTPGTARAAS